MSSEQGNVELTDYSSATRNIRFEIEDVDDELPGTVVTGDGANTSAGQNTITSLAYNTSEAVPNTLYYRDDEVGDAKHRPSLEALQLGKPLNINTVPLGENIPEDVQVEIEESPVKPRWWHRFRSSKKKDKAQKKLGWIVGVLIRCLLNIWGVMLFIRLSWVVGQAGIGLASAVILLSTVVTVVTTLSMSAICTNGQVKGGGAYYLISRSLGPEFGGAIGIIFSLANAVAVALYIVGFAETVVELMVRTGVDVDGITGELNMIRIIGYGTAILLLCVALVGLDWESKIQLVLLAVLLIALVNTVIGTFIPRSCDHDDRLQGFTGYSTDTFLENIKPDFRGENFFTVFAVFFPAATGILAGANISGDLKDPQKAIPKGTLLAIAITSTTYLFIAWVFGLTTLRDAPGSPQYYFGTTVSDALSGSTFNCTSVVNGTSVLNDTISYCSNKMYSLASLSSYSNGSCNSSDCRTLSCDYNNASQNDLWALCHSNDVTCFYGSLNYFQVAEMISGFGPIVTAGIFAATLSSALTSLVSAPKIFQRVCQDNIFPFIHIFGKGGWKRNSKNTEPILGYFLTFIIALAIISIGELNTIALIISNFFLMAYTLINFSCFAASFSKSPGWRPAFKYYSMWVALAGSVMCLAIMFVISWWAALITLAAVAALYLVVSWRKPDINWGSSTQAFYYTYSMRHLLKLEKLEDHVKNFRPQFLVLTGLPSARPDLVYFVSHMSREVGIMICGHVITDNSRSKSMLLIAQQRKWLRSKKLRGFYNPVISNSLRGGALSLLQLSGLGKLRPNTLVVGFKNSWTNAKTTQQEIDDYVGMLHDAFDLQFGVIVFRLRAGFDATDEHLQGPSTATAPDKGKGRSNNESSPVPPEGVQPLLHQAPSTSTVESQHLTEIPLNEDELETDSPAPLFKSTPRKATDRLNLSVRSLRSYQRVEDEEDLLEEEYDQDTSVNSYSAAMERGDEIDILTRRQSDLPPTPEVPDIVSLPSRFEKKQESGTIDVWWLYDDGGLAILLPFLLSRHKLWKKCKLRIVTAGSSQNIDSARLRMTSLLRKFRIDFSDVIEVVGINRRPSKDSIDRYLSLPLDEGVDESNLDKKTLKQIRIGEMLRETSSDARLIVVTIPVPQRSGSSRQYLSWLEIMSWNLPPILLMRGNQTSVLTFYS